MLFRVCAFSQTPIQWTYSIKKVSGETYEVHIKASVQSPWHIYSQSTPDGGPLATNISFSKNPLIQLQGEVKENGKMIKNHEDVFGVDVKYFDGDVEFVQVVKVASCKGQVSVIKTNVSETIEFMACKDEQCLPPKISKFSVKLE